MVMSCENWSQISSHSFALHSCSIPRLVFVTNDFETLQIKKKQQKRTLANILKLINALHSFIWIFISVKQLWKLNVISDPWLYFFPGLWTASLWGYFWCHSGIKQWWAAAFTNSIVLKPTIIIMPEPCEQKQNLKITDTCTCCRTRNETFFFLCNPLTMD